jgi:hypothetical protein
MARDYTWARRTLGRHMVTIGELATMLGVGRHQARRRLLASSLPAKLVTRRWKDRHGCWYMRRTWAVPMETFRTLLIQQIERDWNRDARVFGKRAPRFPREHFYCNESPRPKSPHQRQA